MGSEKLLTPTEPAFRHPRLRCLAAPALAVTLLLYAASACSSEPAPEKSPQLAMQQIASLLPMSEEQATCMRSAIEAKPGLASVLNVKTKPSDKRINEFTAAVLECIPPEELAGILARLATASANTPDDAAQCVRDQILGANEEDRALFLMIQLNGNALSTSSQLRVEQLTTSVITTCKLAEIPPAPGGPPLPPEGGATQLSR